MENVIEVTGLSKQYKAQMAVDNVSFTVKRGSIVGLIGPNGAGKTTIMKMLGGLVYPSAGEIKIFGESTESGLCKARSRMCFIIEAPYIRDDFTAEENVEKLRLQKGIPGKERVKEVLAKVGLENTGKKQAKQFSLGMKQRLGIAMSLLSKPEIMVLDEPINGLDPQGIVEIRNLLLKLSREEHVTILISSHILSELGIICSDYLFINKGQIIKDVSAEDLTLECRQYIHLHTDNDELAGTILTGKMGLTGVDFSEKGYIRIYDMLDDVKLLSKTLYENGVIPTELFIKQISLEKYYMDMVGETYVEYN